MSGLGGTLIADTELESHGYVLRDDTEIRTGEACFEGREEAYSLFKARPDQTWERVMVFCGPVYWTLEKAKEEFLGKGKRHVDASV
jgi:hypothetical protein